MGEFLQSSVDIIQSDSQGCSESKEGKGEGVMCSLKERAYMVFKNDIVASEICE